VPCNSATGSSSIRQGLVVLRQRIRVCQDAEPPRTRVALEVINLLFGSSFASAFVPLTAVWSFLCSRLMSGGASASSGLNTDEDKALYVLGQNVGRQLAELNVFSADELDKVGCCGSLSRQCCPWLPSSAVRCTLRCSSAPRIHSWATPALWT